MLSHVDHEGKAQMVDISHKTSCAREALAQCLVKLPKELEQYFQKDDIYTAKGAVFSTARIAGIMAAKNCASLIPMCHPLAISACDIDFSWEYSRELKISALVKTRYATGVEMEALTAVSVAALTVYDMTKAVSSNIEISTTKLVYKKKAEESAI